MIQGHKISVIIIGSRLEWGCYPYIEMIKSFLSIVDEVVVMFDVAVRDDGSRQKIEAIGDKKIRLISSLFSVDQGGWGAVGMTVTHGYHAATGDIILKVDADGVLHEKDQGLLVKDINNFINQRFATGYWGKNKIYRPNLYYSQYKHSGIYNKRLLGDRFDYFRVEGTRIKGAPNFMRLNEKEQHSLQFDTTLYGYEHVWDTLDVIKEKLERFGRMIDDYYHRPFKTADEYYEAYETELIASLKVKGKSMSLQEHPAIMQEKLKGLTEQQHGFSFFNFKV